MNSNYIYLYHTLVVIIFSSIMATTLFILTRRNYSKFRTLSKNKLPKLSLRNAYNKIQNNILKKLVVKNNSSDNFRFIVKGLIFGIYTMLGYIVFFGLSCSILRNYEIKTNIVLSGKNMRGLLFSSHFLQLIFQSMASNSKIAMTMSILWLICTESVFKPLVSIMQFMDISRYNSGVNVQQSSEFYNLRTQLLNINELYLNSKSSVFVVCARTISLKWIISACCSAVWFLYTILYGASKQFLFIILSMISLYLIFFYLFCNSLYVKINYSLLTFRQDINFGSLTSRFGRILFLLYALYQFFIAYPYAPNRIDNIFAAWRINNNPLNMQYLKKIKYQYSDHAKKIYENIFNKIDEHKQFIPSFKEFLDISPNDQLILAFFAKELSTINISSQSLHLINSELNFSNVEDEMIRWVKNIMSQIVSLQHYESAQKIICKLVPSANNLPVMMSAILSTDNSEIKNALHGFINWTDWKNFMNSNSHVIDKIKNSIPLLKSIMNPDIMERLNHDSILSSVLSKNNINAKSFFLDETKMKKIIYDLYSIHPIQMQLTSAHVDELILRLSKINYENTHIEKIYQVVIDVHHQYLNNYLSVDLQTAYRNQLTESINQMNIAKEFIRTLLESTSIVSSVPQMKNIQTIYKSFNIDWNGIENTKAINTMSFINKMHDYIKTLLISSDEYYSITKNIFAGDERTFSLIYRIIFEINKYFMYNKKVTPFTLIKILSRLIDDIDHINLTQEEMLSLLNLIKQLQVDTLFMQSIQAILSLHGNVNHNTFLRMLTSLQTIIVKSVTHKEPKYDFPVNQLSEFIHNNIESEIIHNMELFKLLARKNFSDNAKDLQSDVYLINFRQYLIQLTDMIQIYKTTPNNNNLSKLLYCSWHLEDQLVQYTKHNLDVMNKYFPSNDMEEMKRIHQFAPHWLYTNLYTSQQINSMITYFINRNAYKVVFSRWNIFGRIGTIFSFNNEMASYEARINKMQLKQLFDNDFINKPIVEQLQYINSSLLINQKIIDRAFWLRYLNYMEAIHFHPNDIHYSIVLSPIEIILRIWNRLSHVVLPIFNNMVISQITSTILICMALFNILYGAVFHHYLFACVTFPFLLPIIKLPEQNFVYGFSQTTEPINVSAFLIGKILSEYSIALVLFHLNSTRLYKQMIFRSVQNISLYGIEQFNSHKVTSINSSHYRAIDIS